MSTFNNRILFTNRTARTSFHKRSLRHVIHHDATGNAIHLAAAGRDARLITHTGRLVADSPGQLHDAIADFESLLDAQPHTLIDERSRSHDNLVLLAIDPKHETRLGRRYQLTCQLLFIQLTP